MEEEESPSMTPSYDWPYRAIQALPKFLTGLRELRLHGLPTLHPAFIFHCFRFLTVDFLKPCAVDASFHDIASLASLQAFEIRRCEWRRPAHYHSGRQRTFTTLDFFSSRSAHGEDFLGWISTSHSAVALTHLDWGFVFHDQIPALNKVLESCEGTLQVARF